nr:hypothetical protein PRUPE_4G033100 [Ipomoea batatas]
MENLPGEGLLELVQQVKSLLSPAERLTLMPGKNESVGWLKLVHIVLLGLQPGLLRIISSPVSLNTMVALLEVTELFVFQTDTFLPCKTTKLPFPVSPKAPFLSKMGFSLLATQTTDCGVIPEYHIPTYLLLVPLGLKNPNTNLSFSETMFSPSSLIHWPC